jgi:PAS domain S-box-containing protein
MPEDNPSNNPQNGSVLASVFQAAEGAMSLVDRDLNYVMFNRQFIEDHKVVTGLEPVRGEAIYGVFPPEVREARKLVLASVLSGNKEVIENRYVVGGKAVYYRSSFSPVTVNGEVIGITTYSINCTEQKTAEEQLLRLNRFYQFLSQINQMIVRAEDEETILRETCRIAVEHGKFRMAWAGLYDAGTGDVTPVTWAGHEEGYLKLTGFSALERPEGSGPTGRAIRSGAPVYTNDVATDPSFTLWREAALARGYHSSMSLPLFADSRIVAVVALYMEQSSFFTASEIQMLKELTDNISFALDKIRLRISEKQSQEQALMLSRLYLFISKVNESMLHRDSREEIYSEACRLAVEYGRFKMAWFGLYDATNDRIVPVRWAGDEDGLFHAIGMDGMKVSTGVTPSARAIQTRRYFCYNDIGAASELGTIRGELLKRGYGACISFPIIVDGQAIAVLLLLTAERNFFNETEIGLLREVTGNIAGALDKIRRKELTERTAAELKESEEKFRTLVEQNQTGVYILQEKKFIYANPMMERITGYSAAELMAMENFADLVYKDDRDQALGKYNRRIAGQMIVDDYVARIVRKDGSIAHVQTIASGITYRNASAAIGSVIDITDRIEENRQINKAVIAAQERERVQIGMELHDNVQQIISGSLMTLDVAIASYGEQQGSLSALEDVQRYLSECMVELRRLSHQLVPSMTFEENLGEKVQALIDTMNVGQSAKVDLKIQRLRKPPNKETQIAFYRILQEQLTNIIKYSGASRITISLMKADNHLRLSIKDNGRGFDLAAKKNGIGLENIRRRVSALEGDMKIISSVGNGCELVLEVPAC